jgi:hypothetical protein
MANQFSGRRWLAWGMVIWDFNQHHVKRLGKDFVAETETAHISVVTKESHAAAMGDNDPFSSL